MRTRPPVAAGHFYPADADELASTVDALLSPPCNTVLQGKPGGLRGLVAPHAGYLYSGPIAASAFRLAPRQAKIALLGPSHFVALDGLAVTSADVWTTPLGEVQVDDELRSAALAAGARVDDGPHARDHALEVELPFLQRACPDGLTILPVAVGRYPSEDVASLIAGLGDALVVVSTDLSHYLDDAAARRVDRATAEAVIASDPRGIRDDAACGVYALRGLIEHARRRGLVLELLDLRTSADTAGTPDRVVGYGAFAVRQT